MPEVLLLVSVLTASHAGNLVLGFYVKVFSSSHDILDLDCSFIRSNLTESLSQILLIVKVLSPSSNSSHSM